MIWVAFGIGFVVGTFVGIFTVALCYFGSIPGPPPMDESSRPVITPNPPPRVVK